jgi:hypothetical protein
MVKKDALASETRSIASYMVIVARRSVSWTFGGGVPERKEAWFNPGTQTTGWVYFVVS